MYKNPKDKDPIAEKLKATKQPSHDTAMWYQGQHQEVFSSYKGTLEEHHAKFTAQHPQASYETWEILDSDDPMILKMMKDLGVNPDATVKAVITVEAGEPVKIEATCYPFKNHEPIIGSPLKAYDKEKEEE